MSVPYIEKHIVLGITFGIEDYQDGKPAKEHFFADKRKKRYHCWMMGCGIGETDTLLEARELLALVIVGEIHRKRREISDMQDAIEKAEEFLNSGALGK